MCIPWPLDSCSEFRPFRLVLTVAVLLRSGCRHACTFLGDLGLVIIDLRFCLSRPQPFSKEYLSTKFPPEHLQVFVLGFILASTRHFPHRFFNVSTGSVLHGRTFVCIVYSSWTLVTSTECAMSRLHGIIIWNCLGRSLFIGTGFKQSWKLHVPSKLVLY